MRYSEYFLPTLREIPADAEVISHQLMLRAGMIRRVAAGIYDILPIGLRVIRKVENIIREEMDRAGAQEVFLPSILPAELWQETGRWDLYGKELLRMKDRHDREFCYGPTHEEVITDLVRREVRSYRQLPLNLYQIQTKFRDEIRPRFGLMRGREFTMKDAYSFDRDREGAEKSYQAMFDAYTAIFKRCGLEFRAVEADSGKIGGSLSHEFMVLADTGEDRVVACGSCDYAANLEMAEVAGEAGKPGKASGKTIEKVQTPGLKTVEEVSKFLKVNPDDLVKTIILSGEGGPVAVMARGDHEVNPVKVRRMVGDDTLDLAEPDEVARVTGAPIGYAGPIGLKIPLYADYAVSDMADFVTGANEADAHMINVNLGDFEVSSFGDLREAVVEDPCPQCGGEAVFLRGIEVGHIFYLGNKYSKAMDAVFLDENGVEKIIEMGCFGIGVGRTAAAAVEQNHDSNGIIWPMPIAPFQVYLLSVNPSEDSVMETSEKLYEAFTESGIEVLYDDRDERPGVKFKDADLIGVPLRLTVGKKALAEGKVEVKERATGDEVKVPLEGILDAIKDKLA
ncbi:MAG: proline--tRNA ligase [bacterium]